MAHKLLLITKLHMVQYMGTMLEIPHKYLTHTLREMILFSIENLAPPPETANIGKVTVLTSQNALKGLVASH